MTSTTKALRRLGVAAVAAVTLGAGLPLALSGAASAQAAPSLTISSDGTTTTGNCEVFTVTRQDADGSDTPTATITVTEVPNTGDGDVTFCDPETGTLSNESTAGDGTAEAVFVNSATSFRFGLFASAPVTVDIVATSPGFTGDTERVTFGTPSASPPPSATPTATAGTGGGGGGGPGDGNASPGATATPTGTASPTTGTGTGSPTGSPTASPTGTARPTGTASPADNNRPATPPGCARAAEVMLGRTTIIATGSAPVSVNATPNSVVDLFAYTRPSTQFRLVRSGTTDSAGNITFRDLRPPANTRLRPQQRGCAFGRDKVLNVRTQISLNVVRNGRQNYTFSGRLLPARPGGLIASLYRVTNDGRQILTSQARANTATGQYVINRRFTGTGRFGFVVRTGQDLQNAPGSSNVRSLLVF